MGDRVEDWRGAPGPAMPRVLRWIGVLLVLGLVLPVGAHQTGGWGSPKQTVFKWWWDAFEGLEGRGQLFAICLLVSPFVGAAVLGLGRVRDAKTRGLLLTLLGGAYVATWLVGLGDIRSTRETIIFAAGLPRLGLILTALLLGGLFATIRRPDHRLTCRLTGFLGCLTILLALLPLGEQDQTYVGHIAVALEGKPKLPQLAYFATGALGLAAAAVAACLLIPARPSRKHARGAVYVVVAMWCAGLVFFVAFATRRDTDKLLPASALAVGLFAIRLFPILALAGLGLSEMLLLGAGPDPDQARDTPASSIS